MKGRIRRSVLHAVALAIAVLALTVGGATAGLDAAVAVEDGVIKACRHKSGVLLIPSAGKACKRSEQALSWNVQGPAGPAGKDGHRVRTARPGRPGRRATRVRPAPPAPQAPPARQVPPARQALPVPARP